MDRATQTEKNRDRIEKRSAYVTEETGFLRGREEWHYYISSRRLTAAQLLHHARMEWTVETMHWLLDVHFGEDGCRIEDRNIQQNLNMLRKAALNLIK